MNLKDTIIELHKAYDLFNTVFYDNKLPEVAIVVQTKGKANAYGWFTTKEVWVDKEQDIKRYEITITAEHVNRPYVEVLRTLHHEMIHLYCAINDIQDTSRGGTYHNKRFKEESEKHGFFYPEGSYDKKCGWSFSELKPETIAIIESWGIDPNAFRLARLEFGGVGATEKKKSNIIKWTCPCGTIIRSSKPEINVACLDCGGKFVSDAPTEGDE